MKEMVTSLCDTVSKEGERFHTAVGRSETRSRKDAVATGSGAAPSKAAVEAMLAELELRWEQKQVSRGTLSLSGAVDFWIRAPPAPHWMHPVHTYAPSSSLGTVVTDKLIGRDWNRVGVGWT
jgi:hypothetical protein